MIRSWAVVIAMLAALAEAEPGQVTLRGGRVIDASEVTPTVDALRVTTGGQAQEFGWHEVRSVTGRAAGETAPFMPDAEKAWRGLSRLDRDDRVAAEPLLEEVFADLAGHTGPTAGAVSEGLLVCRAARGAQALALEPYLTLVRSNQVEVTSEILDPGTALFPALPPIWGSESGLAPIVTSIASEDFAKWDTRGRARQLAELYVTAAMYEIAGEAPLTDFAPVDEGVKLVQEIVHARVGDEAERAEARQLLESRLSRGIPDWQQAWVHAAIGLSLLVEGDDHSSRLGIVQLLYVPAQHAQPQPYLAGVCLAEAAVRLAEMGRSDAAVTLAGELSRAYSRHPSTEHPLVRELINQYESKTAPAPPGEEDA